MGSRHLADVQLSHLYKWRAAELPGIGRQLPHCRYLSCTFPVQSMMKCHHSPVVPVLPQCPLLADTLINTFQHNALPWHMSSFHHGHTSSLHNALFLSQYQQPSHPPPGPASFPYKLLSPWQLPKRGHYLGDIGDRRWKAGAGPSDLHQKTRGRERCACLLYIHIVNLWFCKPEGNNLPQTSFIVQSLQASFLYCSAVVFGLSPALDSHPAVTRPPLADTHPSITAVSTHCIRGLIVL